MASDVHAMVLGRADYVELIDRAWWSRLALTVSFGPFGRFTPPRGRALVNQPIRKLDLYGMMFTEGVATPCKAAFRFGVELPEAE